MLLSPSYHFEYLSNPDRVKMELCSGHRPKDAKPPACPLGEVLGVANLEELSSCSKIAAHFNPFMCLNEDVLFAL